MFYRSIDEYENANPYEPPFYYSQEEDDDDFEEED